MAPGPPLFDPLVADGLFQSVVEHVAEAVYLLRNGRLVFVNQRFADLMAYSREELLRIGLDPVRLVAPESRAVVEDRRRARDRGEAAPTEYEFTAIRGDGARIRLSVRNAVLPDCAGIAIVGTVRDVTALRATEERLFRKSALLLALNGVFRKALADEDESHLAGKLVEAAREFTGSPVGYVGELAEDGGFRLLAGAEDAAAAEEIGVRGAWSLPILHGGAFVANPPRAAPSLKSFLGLPLRHDGRIFGSMVLAGRAAGYDAEDVADVEAIVMAFVETLMRRRAEVALRRSQERSRRLVEHAVFGIGWASPDGLLTDANPALVRMLGYDSREDLLAAAPALLSAEALEAEEAEIRWTRRDGSELRARVNGTVVRDAAGGVAALEFIAEDVTRQRRFEEELRRADRLAAIGQLAGGVAHDFNNLLTVVSGQAGLGAGALPEDHPARARFAEIRRVVDRAGHLTRQLLVFSRRQRLELHTLDLNTVVRDVEKMLRRLIPENVHLAVELEPALRTVRADPSRLEQVLVNLVVNARDAMPDGGVVAIRTENIVLDEGFAGIHPDAFVGPGVLATVADNGIGMSPEVRERIFEPFFTTKPEGRGVGLGLATTYGTVKQCGGMIHVYSEPGIGTIFRIYLPAVRESAGDAPEGAGEPDGGTLASRGETILIAEDEPGVRELAAEVLRDAGYTVLTARNGVEAVAMAGGHEGVIDLLLTDVVMPKLGGAEVEKAVSAGRPRMRTLFMSGYPDGSIASHGVLSPGRRLLPKPFSPDELLRRVREALDE